MSSATVEGESVDNNVRLKQAVIKTIFHNIIRHSFKFPEAWVAIQGWLIVC